MLPFMKLGPIDHGERKALLFAGLFCCLFIVVLGVARPHPRPTRRLVNDFEGVPPPAPYKFREGEPSNVNSLDAFRVKPKQFEEIDFKNHSFGPYISSNGKTLDLNLKGGALQLPNRSGWFALKDVYYTDMTGDGQEEAIVWMNHVTCGASCNGGANLFYIYAERDGKLKRIWQHETGSYERGCGLKSFILSEKQIVVELFGDCTLTTTDDSAPLNFSAQGFTSIRLEFDGQRFAQKSIDFFITPPRDVKNYEPDIHIYNPPSPESHSDYLWPQKAPKANTISETN